MLSKLESRRRLSKCTHVGVKLFGSTYDHTFEFNALVYNCALLATLNVCPASNAKPA